MPDYTEDEAAADLVGIRDRPPNQVGWYDLTRLTERDPDAMRDIWQGVQAAARDEVASGHRTGDALKWDGNPWQRAQFMAIRASFRADHQPRSSIESTMVDLATEACGDYLEWAETVHRRASLDAETEERDADRHGHWKPQRVSWQDSLDHAAPMAERAHARFLRTVKTLTDLWRAAPVYVGQAGQVNVAQAASDRDDEEPP